MRHHLRAIRPAGVDLALDVAGSGVLAELVQLAGGAEHVITIADVDGAQRTGVRFSRGDTGRAAYALAHVARMASTGQYFVRVGQTFPLTEVAEAHRIGEAGTVRGKLVLIVD